MPNFAAAHGKPEHFNEEEYMDGELLETDDLMHD